MNKQTFQLLSVNKDWYFAELKLFELKIGSFYDVNFFVPSYKIIKIDN
jgi:hypothetical protein